jgi:hypothetical protein
VNLDSVHYLPEHLVHVLHTLGAKTSDYSIPRSQRRRFERRFGYEHPKFYRVDLRGSDSEKSGISDWHYRHRWLVRGHYRLSEAGLHNVPGKGLCTWVRPYVKGPAGAPWKGRAVYHSSMQDASS